ncbi:MAG: hypothetical protein OCU12_02670 [Methanophagales archaeon]|nr:hypothetical protein [Methanophagales archaeon]
MDSVGKAVVVFSLLGVCGLYGLSLTSLVEPPFVPLEAVASGGGSGGGSGWGSGGCGEYEGQLVRTRGVLTDLRTTAAGDLLTIKANGSELLVFVFLDSAVGATAASARKERERLNLGYGDEVVVQGKVQSYRGRCEIVAEKVGCKNETANSSVSVFVSQVAENPEEYEGRRVSVVGCVGNVYKNIFYLGDEKGKYLMRVNLKSVSISRPELKMQKGEKIIAEGVFAYNAENLRYELNLVSVSEI